MRSYAVAPEANLVSDQRAPDQRSDERFTTLFRVARVVLEDGAQHLCLIRNIGAGGLMLETYARFDTGTAVRVEPKGSAPVNGKICWVKDRNAGVTFDAPIDVAAYLNPHQLSPTLEAPRGPRLTVDRRARLRVGVMWHLVDLIDLSQKGAKVKSDLPMELEASVELMVERLAPVSGRVRWIKEDRIGIEFSRAIALADLAEWVSALSDEEAAPAGD
ncbi:PilZ domain-containing protein [Sphingomonas sp. BT-65]|uniref:PilZ domain-containing protein n=1 Tax=Sphingomonas sp. BT-65 TaxID=2989821 RepID=UPI0022357B7C|nr:PilZ domain-containing protein [Sphingomonas sp. BT-65]MCW4462221.1 PilZ domain-containing protein [Sphingomonas sp. BT-65]